MGTTGFYGGKFTIPHKGHQYLMTIASTMVDKLYVIVSYDDDYEAGLYENTGLTAPSYLQRVRWWEMMTAHLPHIEVRAVNEPYTGDFSGWEEGARLIRESMGNVPIDKVFSAEPSYDDYFKILYPEAEHVVIDPERTRFPISTTMIRQDGVARHWDMIPPEVRRDFVKKIVVVGTESNGKSTLVKNLAALYDTNYVGEYGREIYEHWGSYTTLPSDYAAIAIGHTHKVNEAIEDANRILFVDTEDNVTRNFLIDYENIYDDKVVNAIAQTQDYDLWLFLEPDVPWVDDGSRFLGEPDVRARSTDRLKKMIKDNGHEFVTISGNYQERLTTAIEAVDNFIAQN